MCKSIPNDLPSWEPYPHENNAFIIHVGSLWQRIVEGVLEYAFRVGAIHSNQNHYAHEGMIATVADFLLSGTLRFSTTTECHSPPFICPSTSLPPHGSMSSSSVAWN
jgi:hypothetical protein